MVRKERLELSQVAPLEPKSSASTNSATFANSSTVGYKPLFYRIKQLWIVFKPANFGRQLCHSAFDVASEIGACGKGLTGLFRRIARQKNQCLTHTGLGLVFDL